MRKLIFFVAWLLILTLGCATTPPLQPSAEKLEAPILNVGDRWKFRGPDNYEWTDEVIAVKPDEYWIRVEGSVLKYDRNTMNVITPPNSFWETHGKRLNFPLYSWKKWTHTTRKIPYSYTIEVNYLNDFRVSSYEEVTTLAGKFKAYKIMYRQTNLDYNISGTIEFWYSPEVKWFVKRRVEPGRYWPATRWVQDFELIEYRLK
jgi:hypothetical protein